jgi:cytoskeletal protein RodZ
MEYNEETKDQDMLEETESESSMKQWLQDNLRIIVSAFIVIVIAAGIYSYSSRTENSAVISEETTEEQSGGLLSQITGEEQASTEETPAENQAAQEQQVETKRDEQISPAPSSQETETSFMEKAVSGDGTTRMARRALANYLEKNPDSSLSAEHKIYIEDYLRKNIPQKRVFVGDSVEFQKNLIQDAISQSKKLNENQLRNLQKYSARVPSLA